MNAWVRASLHNVGGNQGLTQFLSLPGFLWAWRWLYESKRAKTKWQVGPEAALLRCGSRRPLGQCLRRSKVKVVAERCLEGPGGAGKEHSKRRHRLPEFHSEMMELEGNFQPPWSSEKVGRSLGPHSKTLPTHSVLDVPLSRVLDSL